MTLATVTGLSAWVVVAGAVCLSIWALLVRRAVCKRDDEQLASRTTDRSPELWPWPNRLLQQKAPGCSSSTGAQRARS